MSANENELPPKNAPPPPLVQADPAAVVGRGAAMDMDGMGAGDGGIVVGGGLRGHGGGPTAPVVNPLQQQQPVVPL